MDSVPLLAGFCWCEGVEVLREEKTSGIWQLVGAEAVHRHSISEASQNTPPDEASRVSVFVKLTAFLLTGKCLYYMATNGWKMQKHSQSSGIFFPL